MGADGWIVICVLAAAIAAFVSNRLRVDAVAIGVILALAVSGIVSSGEAIAGFSDSSVLMIAGLFVVGEALIATGVAAALGAWLAKAGRGSEVRLIALLMIVAAMVVIMTFGVLPNVIAVLLAALTVVGTGCVDGKSAYRNIGWSTVVLIAGMLPLATALDKTGLTDVMATALTHTLADVGPYGMLALLFLVASVVGLFISNTVTALLIAPVAIGAAQDLGVSPHAFAVTVAVAASCAFVTPVSSPVNTLVLEPGHYRFVDFIKVGLPLLVLALTVTVAMVGMLYPLSPPMR